MKHKLSHTLLAVIMALTLTLSIMAVPVSAASVTTYVGITVGYNPYQKFQSVGWMRDKKAAKYVLYKSYDGGKFTKVKSFTAKSFGNYLPTYNINNCEDGKYSYKVYVYDKNGKKIEVQTSKTYTVNNASTGAYKLVRTFIQYTAAAQDVEGKVEKGYYKKSDGTICDRVNYTRMCTWARNMVAGAELAPCEYAVHQTAGIMTLGSIQYNNSMVIALDKEENPTYAMRYIANGNKLPTAKSAAVRLLGDDNSGALDARVIYDLEYTNFFSSKDLYTNEDVAKALKEYTKNIGDTKVLKYDEEHGQAVFSYKSNKKSMSLFFAIVEDSTYPTYPVLEGGVNLLGITGKTKNVKAAVTAFNSTNTVVTVDNEKLTYKKFFSTSDKSKYCIQYYSFDVC